MSTAQAVVARASLIELSLAAVALGVGALLGIEPLSSLLWDPGAVLIGSLAALPLLCAFAVSWRSPVRALRGIRTDLESILPRLFRGVSPLGLGIVSLAAGVGEEALFRGLLQTWLEDSIGPGAGLVAASAIFGLAHPLSLAYVVVAATMGAYLGWLWQVTGNLLVPITTHAVYDFVVLYALLARRS